jgi:hypothetical protein
VSLSASRFQFHSQSKVRQTNTQTESETSCNKEQSMDPKVQREANREMKPASKSNVNLDVSDLSSCFMSCRLGSLFTSYLAGCFAVDLARCSRPTWLAVSLTRCETTFALPLRVQGVAQRMYVRHTLEHAANCWSLNVEHGQLVKPPKLNR